MREINVMVDLETTGIKPGCCILEIGATVFSGPEYRYGEQPLFYQTIFHEGQYGLGLVDAPATMDWWDKQSEAAKAEAFNSSFAVELPQALNSFAGYLDSLAQIKDVSGAMQLASTLRFSKLLITLAVCLCRGISVTSAAIARWSRCTEIVSRLLRSRALSIMRCTTHNIKQCALVTCCVLREG